MMQKGRAEAGFTLLETLVALAVLGAIMSTVYGVIGSGLRSAHRDEDRLLLGLVAQNLLARSRLDLDPVGGALTGDIDGGLRWRIESEPYAIPEDILPEALPTRDDSSFGGASDRESTPRSEEPEPESLLGRGGQSDPAASPTVDGAEAGEEQTGTGDNQTGQQAREPIRLRLIRVVVEKGDQRFALSTLDEEPRRAGNQAR